MNREFTDYKQEFSRQSLLAKVFSETNFSVGLDAAVGIDDWGLYFQIGEAF